MRIQLGIPVPALMLAAAMPAWAQWDAISLAKGWARTDITGAATFYDATSKTLHLWSMDGTQSAAVNASKLDKVPEYYFIDSRNNAWVTSANTLTKIDKNGKLGNTIKLPGEVADLAWDAKYLFLAFKGNQAYIEARDFNDGALTWSYGTKPEGTGPLSTRIAVSDKGQVLVQFGSVLSLTALDPAKGKVVDQISLTLNGKPVALPSSPAGIPALHACLGENRLAMALPAEQLPGTDLRGLLILSINLDTRTITVKPSGLTEGHLLLGFQDKSLLFVRPQGGLVPLEGQ